MTRLISLASGVLPEHPPETVVEAGAAAGFAAVGLRIDGHEWTARRLSRLRRAMADAGVRALDAEVLWIQPGPADEHLLALADVAIELGAENLLVVSSDPDACAGKLAAICERAAAASLPVSLEFGHFSKVHTLGAALAIVAAAGSANARVLVDPLHLSRSRGTVAEVAAAPAALFHYAQFCDAGPVAPDTGDVAAIRKEALDGRLLPGEGVLPLRELLEALPPGLPLSIELRSKRLREAFPDPVARARRVRSATEAWLQPRPWASRALRPRRQG